MEFITFWIACGVVAGTIGSRKGEGGLSFFLGLLLGPVGILIALVSKGDRITCPYCKELIHKQALACKHCGQTLKARTKKPMPVMPSMVDQVAAWEAEQARARADSVECPECGAAIPSATVQVGTNFCPACGKEFHAK